MDTEKLFKLFVTVCAKIIRELLNNEILYRHSYEMLSQYQTFSFSRAVLSIQSSDSAIFCAVFVWL